MEKQILNVYEMQDVSFSYTGTEKKQLNHLSFEIKEGAFVLLIGSSGSGKTTLLRHLKKELQPKGDLKGSVIYKGNPVDSVDAIESVTDVGMVYQSPEDQLVMDTVINELTFPMENIGLPRDEMRLRLAETVAYFGIEKLLHKKIHTLSGGQKQMINLCSVLMLRPNVLIFDEPTAELDPIARKEFLQMVHQLNRDLNITIIMSEHILNDVMFYTNQVLYMDKGELIYDLEPKEFCQQFNNDQHFGYLPETVQVGQFFGDIKTNPLTVKETKLLLNQRSEALLGKELIKRERSIQESARMTLKMDRFRYPGERFDVLENIDVALYPGEILGILGANGVGKSTLLKALSGFLSGQMTKMTYENTKISKKNKDMYKSHIGYVSQYSKVHFTRQSVREELNLAYIDKDKWREELMTLFQLDHLLDQHPYDLSVGEQEKLAIMLALSKEPEVLLLDEPTKGLDPISKAKLGQILIKLCGKGTSICLVTHDTEFSAKYTNRTWFMFEGEVVYDGDSREFLSSNHYYTTTTNLVMKSFHDDCLTIEDVGYYFSH